MMVFFENEHCVKCGESLGFYPGSLEMKTPPKAAGVGAWRNCANKDKYQVCNWMVPEGDSSSFCLACSLNEIIPDLTVAGNRERWYKLELAKRRCLYTFLQLGLPFQTGAGDGRPALHFRFLGDAPGSPPVLTGHENGLITVNIAEADEDERERRRLKMHEPYRTLIGHIRHESGHYYWDRLIANSPHVPKFRELFGDESVDYNESLQKYYQNGPAADWAGRTVTAYACLHPWEDWAETWAHYLHIVDTCETAAGFGLTVATAEPTASATDFDKLLSSWLPLACAVNSINRGMGLPDLYPFIITDAVAQKLRFIHELIQTESKLK